MARSSDVQPGHLVVLAARGESCEVIVLAHRHCTGHALLQGGLRPVAVRSPANIATFPVVRTPQRGVRLMM